MSWQENFKASMAKHRWRQSEIAQESGVNPNEISRWLRGDHDPSIVNAIRLADAMNLSLDELFRGHMPDEELEAILRESIYKAHAKGLRDSLESSTGTIPVA